MDILRLLIGMAGAVICFIGLISVWLAWLVSESNSGPWLAAIVGGVMFLQAVPLMNAMERERYREQLRQQRKKK
jgi:hypothetical protein